MKPSPEYTELVSVFYGPYPEALALQASLGAAGYETFLPDQIMKAVDPFITGGSPLGARLLAPQARAKETMEAIEEFRKGSANRESAEPAEASTPSGEESEAAIDPVEAALVSMGRKPWLCGVFGVTAPLGIYWGFRYAKLLSSAKRTPPGFLAATLGILFCGLMTLCIFVLPFYAILG